MFGRGKPDKEKPDPKDIDPNLTPAQRIIKEREQREQRIKELGFDPDARESDPTKLKPGQRWYPNVPVRDDPETIGNV